jgi:hypothetical protein
MAAGRLTDQEAEGKLHLAVHALSTPIEACWHGPSRGVEASFFAQLAC